MKLVKTTGLITFVLFTINVFSISDTLKWSVGYGSLFGGGMGLKYEPFTFLNNRMKLHIGTSIGLLPIIDHELNISKRFINIYQNFNKQIIFDKERIDKIFRERYIIPFSINVSYSVSKNFGCLLGYGTLSRVYAYEKLRNGFLHHLHAVEIYKLSAINISLLYKFKQYYGSITFSSFFHALRYTNKSYFTYHRHKFSYSKESYTLTLSFGYYFR